MSNDDTKQQNPNALKRTQSADPFYADELDVLEALQTLERKYGKNFLTKEQRVKLVNSRNIKQVQSGGVVGKGVIGKVPILEHLMSGLLMGLHEDFARKIPKEDWDKMTKEDQEALEDVLFKLKYGSFPGLFEYKLVSEE